MTLRGASCSQSEILLLALLAAPTATDGAAFGGRRVGAIGAINVQAPSMWAISTLALSCKPSIEKAPSRPRRYWNSSGIA
jgi:hypothetical protein